LQQMTSDMTVVRLMHLLETTRSTTRRRPSAVCQMITYRQICCKSGNPYQFLQFYCILYPSSNAKVPSISLLELLSYCYQIPVCKQQTNWNTRRH